MSISVGFEKKKWFTLIKRTVEGRQQTPHGKEDEEIKHILAI